MGEVLQLGGRMFRPAEETTFAQDAAFMALLYDTGVHQEIADGGDIVAAVLRSGRVSEFLAASLVPLGTTWSAPVAADTAAHFATLTDPAEKSKLMQALTTVIVGFFAAASPSATPIPSASAPAEPESALAKPRRRRVAGTGAPSSPPSPITTEPVPAM